MALKLWYHPFASYCRKALVALYECRADFEPILVDLGDPGARDALLAVWPLGKFPVLGVEDGKAIPESTIIIEYLAARFPDSGLLPDNSEAARTVRFWDRFFDNHIHAHMQHIVADRLRPKGARDPIGVEQARAALRTAYPYLESHLADKRWITGDHFTMADCAAQPALHFAQLVEPWPQGSAIDGYLARLRARPSVARTDAEAEPFAHYFPQE